MGVVDGCTDHLRIVKRVGIFLSTLAEPSHQLAYGRNSGRRINLLFRLADALADPRKISKLHECNPFDGGSARERADCTLCDASLLAEHGMADQSLIR